MFKNQPLPLYFFFNAWFFETWSLWYLGASLDLTGVIRTHSRVRKMWPGSQDKAPESKLMEANSCCRQSQGLEALHAWTYVTELTGSSFLFHYKWCKTELIITHTKMLNLKFTLFRFCIRNVSDKKKLESREPCFSISASDGGQCSLVTLVSPVSRAVIGSRDQL